MTELTILISYPHRLKKSKLDKQFTKFMEVFKKLHINIPFADALEQMPSSVKFMKDILSEKRRLSNFYHKTTIKVERPRQFYYSVYHRKIHL